MWSPTIDELCADGDGGAVYAHEIVSLAPGRAGEYLNAVAHEGAERYEDHGLSIVGAFTTAMRSESEAVVVWSIPDWATWAGVEQAGVTDNGLLGWKDVVTELGAYVERTLLVDAPLAPLRTRRQPRVEDRRPLAEL